MAATEFCVGLLLIIALAALIAGIRARDGELMKDLLASLHLLPEVVSGAKFRAKRSSLISTKGIESRNARYI